MLLIDFLQGKEGILKSRQSAVLKEIYVEPKRLLEKKHCFADKICRSIYIDFILNVYSLNGTEVRSEAEAPCRVEAIKD